ncbi:type II secretion system F family protein [Pseudodonghicola xiamenensis]|nr:type II secretion system F family protein [Pseudodonghicola xiamenensis]
MFAIAFSLGLLCVVIAVAALQLGRTSVSEVREQTNSLRRDGHGQTPLSRPAAFLARLFDEKDEVVRAEMKKKLAQAGFSGARAPVFFVFSKLFAGMLIAVAVVVVFVSLPNLQVQGGLHWLIIISLAFLVGYSLPGVIVTSRAQAYVDRIAKGLPDALDLMLVCVEAGQSIDMSLVRVARSLRRLHPELSERFAATAEALRVGGDRASAFERLAYDTDSAELKSFGRAIMQASSMGTPVAETFRVFSADQRQRRVKKIEEQANILPTKLTLGTMFLTVPPFLLLLLAPALYSISKSF